MLERYFGLAGRRALVTGGSSGLGRAIAEAFAEAGARVVVASNSPDDLRKTCVETAANGLDIKTLECSLRGRSEAEQLVREATRLAGGPIDILVSNAGMEGPVGSTGSAEEARYLQVFDVNLHSAYWLAAACYDGMREAGGGSIILMSSLSALRGNRGIGPYAMSKAALAALARNLAVEYGADNIRSNAIAPGMIETAFSRDLLKDPDFRRRRVEEMTPLQRVGQPWEVAGAALYLAGPSGTFVNGAVLSVDGGTLVTDGSAPEG